MQTALDMVEVVHTHEASILALANLKLTAIPSSMLQLQNILRLDLQFNNLTFLPSLTPFKNLKWLNINSNLIQTLPSLESLTSLISLDADNNRLSSFPKFSTQS